MPRMNPTADHASGSSIDSGQAGRPRVDGAGQSCVRRCRALHRALGSTLGRSAEGARSPEQRVQAVCPPDATRCRATALTEAAGDADFEAVFIDSTVNVHRHIDKGRNLVARSFRRIKHRTYVMRLNVLQGGEHKDSNNALDSPQYPQAADKHCYRAASLNGMAMTQSSEMPTLKHVPSQNESPILWPIHGRIRATRRAISTSAG
jgi:hypothetical protein